MPRPKPEIEPVQIAVRLSPKLLADLDAECALSEKSRNGVIAYALMRFFDDQNQLRKRAAVVIEDAAPKDHLTMADVRGPYVSRLKPDKGAKK